MWSVGAILELDDRNKLQEFMRKNTQLEPPKFDPDSGDTIFEYFVSDAGEWEDWETQVITLLSILTIILSKLGFPLSRAGTFYVRLFMYKSYRFFAMHQGGKTPPRFRLY